MKLTKSLLAVMLYVKWAKHNQDGQYTFLSRSPLANENLLWSPFFPHKATADVP